MNQVEIKIATGSKGFAIASLQKVIEHIKADGLKQANLSDAKDNGNYFALIHGDTSKLKLIGV